MSMETIIFLLLVNQRRYIDIRRCSAVQPFNSTIKVIAYAVRAFRIYKRINHPMKLLPLNDINIFIVNQSICL